MLPMLRLRYEVPPRRVGLTIRGSVSVELSLERVASVEVSTSHQRHAGCTSSRRTAARRNGAGRPSPGDRQTGRLTPPFPRHAAATCEAPERSARGTRAGGVARVQPDFTHPALLRHKGVNYLFTGDI